MNKAILFSSLGVALLGAGWFFIAPSKLRPVLGFIGFGLGVVGMIVAALMGEL